MKKLIAVGIAFAASAVAASTAHADVLRFDGNICTGMTACTNFSRLDQGYGDTALVDVQTRYDSTLGATPDNAMAFWDTGYNELVNVAYGTNSQNRASIFLMPTAGYSVTLNSFNLGAWPNRTGAPSSFDIVDGLNQTLFSSGPLSIGQAGNLSDLFTFNLTSNNGIGIVFGPESYNVGIDNVDFSLNRIGGGNGAVPEPSTWAMMLAGFAFVGYGMRRKSSPTVRYALG